MRRVFIESLIPFWSVGVAIVGLSLLNSISVTTVYYVKSGWPELTPQYQTGLESGSSPCQSLLKRSWASKMVDLLSWCFASWTLPPVAASPRPVL